MIPGVGKAIKDVDIDDNAFKSIEAIIYSMTPYERTHPEVMNGSRRQRIASGSGTSTFRRLTACSSSSTRRAK
jgi:signal recognition particle subunit SRP54